MAPFLNGLLKSIGRNAGFRSGLSKLVERQARLVENRRPLKKDAASFVRDLFWIFTSHELSQRRGKFLDVTVQTTQ